MAQPKIKIDPAKVERLARIGMNETQIAYALGCSPDTLRRRKQEVPEIQVALDQGKHRGIADVAEALYRKAVDGDVRAMTRYLKKRAGWHYPLLPTEPSLPDSAMGKIIWDRMERDILVD